jgi:hypothetical protein
MKPSRSRRRLTGIVALVFFAGPATARATYYIVESPDYVRSIWLRLGVTTEGRFSIGVAVDALPATAGVDFSPQSALGPVRVFGGLKVGTILTPAVCSGWAGLSGGAVYAFGPTRPGHFGMQLGAHLEHMPIWNSSGRNAPISFPQLEEGGSARFSWFPRAGVLLEGDLELGVFWAPGGHCAWD